MAIKRKMTDNLQDSALAEKRYGPAAAARELSGLATADNLRGWSDIAKQNSGTYFDTRTGKERQLKPTPGGKGR